MYTLWSSLHSDHHKLSNAAIKDQADFNFRVWLLYGDASVVKVDFQFWK